MPTPRVRRRARTTTAPIVSRILELRREKANLLGFANFADLVLEDRMAHTGERAEEIPDGAEEKTEARFHAENEELAAFRRSIEGPEPAIAPWDVAYYAEKQRAALYDFDEEALRPYFPLERVVDGHVRNRAAPLRHSRRRAARRARVGPGGEGTTEFTTEDGALLGGVLCRLVSAREQARRRVDGRLHHRAVPRQTASSRTWG